LSPIGQYRVTNNPPSKGKRSKKRKREEKKLKEENPKTSGDPPPEISSFVVVGLNSITRSLESLSQKSKALKSADCEKNDADQDPQPPSSGAKDGTLNDNEKPHNNPGQDPRSPSSESKSEKCDAGQTSGSPPFNAKVDALKNIEALPIEKDDQIQEPANSKEGSSQKSAADNASGARGVAGDAQEEPLIEEGRVNYHFSAIFVLRSSQPSILHAHLPQLIATASLAHPKLPTTRLVQLPKGCDERLCEVLGLPRVSFIGLLESAPHSRYLLDVVREFVPEIEVPWLQEAKKSDYLPVKINAVETFVPVAKKEQKVA
jgi:RNase P subunit Pop3